MKASVIFSLAFVFLLVACSKQNSDTAGNTNSTGNNNGGTSVTTINPATISVFINNQPMTVTSINYNRSGSTFNFSAQNSLQKVTANCFWFYQQSRWSFQYSDSITYSKRPDSLTSWTTTRAIDWGTINFDCCSAPLTDSLVDGDYIGNFYVGKDSSLTINGKFHLLFK